MKNNNEENITDYAVPVHKSLLEKKQLFGIGDKVFYTILFITVILASLVSVYCILLGLIAVFVCRYLCKDEPLFFEFLFDNILEADYYEG